MKFTLFAKSLHGLHMINQHLGKSLFVLTTFEINSFWQKDLPYKENQCTYFIFHCCFSGHLLEPLFSKQMKQPMQSVMFCCSRFLRFYAHRGAFNVSSFGGKKTQRLPFKDVSNLLRRLFHLKTQSLKVYVTKPQSEIFFP
ncbi:hypothetical protein ILYODFUR_005343 [Ilyodon furcidens]|uniref:Uncharacterized protein n=1 Tax=Ilyodon furcidens TaxID=33524 RepID=A0ABV0SVM4_9TELE